MAINDEIREQQKKLGEMTFRQKISYIIYYYKIHILVAVLIIAFVASFIHQTVTRKDIALYCAMINSIPVDSELTSLREDFSEYAEIDLDQLDVVIDCSMNINYETADQMSYAYDQKLAALLNTGDVDIFVSDRPVVDSFAQLAAFVDIEKALPDDLKRQLEGTFDYYYYDYIDEDTGETASTPIGIHIYNSRILRECYARDDLQGMYTEEMQPVFCITSTAKNTENAIKFLRYLISEN